LSSICFLKIRLLNVWWFSSYCKSKNWVDKKKWKGKNNFQNQCIAIVLLRLQGGVGLIMRHAIHPFSIFSQTLALNTSSKILNTSSKTQLSFFNFGSYIPVVVLNKIYIWNGNMTMLLSGWYVFPVILTNLQPRCCLFRHLSDEAYILYIYIYSH